jgi:hypothetical protein
MIASMATEIQSTADWPSDSTTRSVRGSLLAFCQHRGATTKWSAGSILAAAVVTILTIGAGAARAPADSPTPEAAEFFEKRIRPILVEKCQKCHGANLQKGELRLDSREGVLKGGANGPAIFPGKPEQSELVRAINYEADGFQMPPTGKLAPESIAALTDWVRRGAPWPNSVLPGNRQRGAAGIDLAERAKHWSFQPLQRHVSPSGAQLSWARNPVDGFIAGRLKAAGLTPAPPASRRAFLRRVTFDLTGLPPTPGEIHNFLADSSPTAEEKLVDRLLASPHYGVRWGRHWLDLVRFAETYGHEFDFEIPDAWRYRDYVVRAFNEDVPYNDFVTEHIAGDLLARPRRNSHDAINESIIGTAFWWFGQGKQAPVDLRAEECDTYDNQIDVLGKALLGLSIACARCHDHKFDPIRTQDYYALAGFLRSSRQQLAFLDDPAPIDGLMKWRRAQATRGVEIVARSLLARSKTDPRPQLNSKGLDRDGDDPDGIGHPWRSLSSLPAGRPFVTRRLELAKSLELETARARALRNRVIVFEDFAKPDFNRWSVTGAAFGHRPSRAGDFVPGATVARPVAQFAPHGAAHSGLISPKLRGTIRSRTFNIEKPFVHYHASRHHANTTALRPLKSGQLNLIVDGFQIVRDPLYGQLSLAVPSDAPAAWYTQDVSKLLGNRAYIEIVDEDDGWIVVDSIVFSDDPQPPPARPNQLIAALVNDASIDSPEKLARRYRKLFEETLNLWMSGQLADDASAGDRVAILEWQCRHLLQPLDAQTAHDLDTLLSEWHDRESSLTMPERVVAMIDGSSENEHVLIRGNHKKPGEEVPRRFLEVFRGQPISPTETGSGRLELARQMTGPATPLLARVLVNRLWHYHFGRGIVSTPDDFGKMGQPPSHPELLDYLAGELIRNGWSIKHMQRMLVLSSTYRMSSIDSDARAAVVDPDNRLVHRMAVKRLEAEAIRDSILAVSGRLSDRLEGPGIPVHLDEFMTGRGRPAHSGPLDGEGRRSIYLAVRRNFLPPMFLAFDYPTPSTTVGRRGASNVPAQALALMNNPFVVQQSEVWAKRLIEMQGSSARADSEPPSATALRRVDTAAESTMIESLYEAAFARLPTLDEQSAARQFLEHQQHANDPVGLLASWSDLCHVIFNTKEFIYVN